MSSRLNPDADDDAVNSRPESRQHLGGVDVDDGEEGTSAAAPREQRVGGRQSDASGAGDYRFIDAFVVIGCVGLLGAIAAALIFVDIPQPNLPILASLASGTFGLTLGLYAGARWGDSHGAKRPPSRSIL